MTVARVLVESYCEICARDIVPRACTKTGSRSARASVQNDSAQIDNAMSSCCGYSWRSLYSKRLDKATAMINCARNA